MSAAANPTLRLHQVMERYGLSVARVAEITCVSVGCVRNWRHGGLRVIPDPLLRLVTLTAQAERRDLEALTPAELAGLEPNPPP